MTIRMRASESELFNDIGASLEPRIAFRNNISHRSKEAHD